MLKIVAKMVQGYERYMTKVGRVHARQVLMGFDDRMLHDNGFSRELLEQGVQAWPWKKVVTQEPVPSIDFERINFARSLAKLESCSDKELSDMGISRSAIPGAVLRNRRKIDQAQKTDGAA